MPELPEVEVVRQGLLALRKDEITGVVALTHKIIRDDLSLLRGSVLEEVERRGRYLKLFFVGNQYTLVVHLGMTGYLKLAPIIKGELTKHEFFRFNFLSGRQLSYYDYRRFGKVFFHPRSSPNWETQLGVEPLSTEFTAEYCFEKAQGRRLALKLFMMDNKVVTGIGNIYANEILFAANQNPERSVWTISIYEWKELVRCTKEILLHAIAEGGSSVKDYLNTQGKSGSYQNFLKVYGHKGKPCVICGNPIKIVRQGGRSSFFCEFCQGR